MIALFFDMFTAAVYFFTGKFLSVCKARTTTYPLSQPGLTGFYGSGLAAYQAGWGW